ncbi:MAG: response regulator [Cyanobacteria bacterium P01_H01_bin.121]
MKILVIDDEDAIREGVVAVLSSHGYDVLAAADGRKGLELAFTSLPDLILCDIAMPEVDGYGVLRLLRDHPSTVTLPFIFFSGRGNRSDIRQGMKLGADDYLPKPFTPAELIEAVESRLKRQQLVSQYYQQEMDALRTHISRALPHELRTPLHGILGSTSFLLSSLDDVETEVVRQMLECIELSGKRLYELIQKYSLYINLDRILQSEEQIHEYRQSCTQFPTFVIEEVALAQATRAARSCDLNLQITDAEVCIQDDDLSHLVREVISNALKFSDPDTPVNITAQQRQTEYRIEISDRGWGMTPEQIASVGAYRQFDRDYYEQQGPGLGLAIVQQIMQIYAGNVDIQSSLGQGTTVMLQLPLSLAQSKIAQPAT